MKEFYNPKAFFTHAALLDQGFPHCPKFPTAASRRSLGRVSVPVWLIILSDQLPIVALVGRYPTNKLIGRGTLKQRPKPFPLGGVCGISDSFPSLFPTARQVPTRYSPVRHSVIPGKPGDLVRLACVKHAASVRSEPGSNSHVKFTNPINRTRETLEPSYLAQDGFTY